MSKKIPKMTQVFEFEMLMKRPIKRVNKIKGQTNNDDIVNINKQCDKRMTQTFSKQSIIIFGLRQTRFKKRPEKFRVSNRGRRKEKRNLEK